MKNRLKEKWARGEPTLGAWISIPSPVTARLMAGVGFDWLTVDMQHGLIGYQRAAAMLREIAASTTTPVVRVPWNEPGIIGKMLDAGAQGLIVPMVNSRQQAEAVVAACRYPPDGRRSYGPMGAAMLYGADYYEAANREVCCLPMIETRQAIDRLDDILSVPGIDGVYVGPNDLSISLGLGPGADQTDERFTAAIAAIVDGCRRHGIVAGAAGTAATAPKRLEEGFLFVEVSRDAGAMVVGAGRDLRSIRDIVEGGQ